MSTCGDGNFPLCRFFDEIFFSQRIYFQALQKKLFFLLLRFHSPTLSVCDLLASSLKCKLLFSSHTKVLLFRPHITRKKPKTFSMNIYFIKKKMLLLMLQSVCMLCYDVRQHHFCKQFIPLYLSFLKRQVRGLKSSSMWLDVKQNFQTPDGLIQCQLKFLKTNASYPLNSQVQ